jgi:hypothetical protein
MELTTEVERLECRLSLECILASQPVLPNGAYTFRFAICLDAPFAYRLFTFLLIGILLFLGKEHGVMVEAYNPGDEILSCGILPRR